MGFLGISMSYIRSFPEFEEQYARATSRFVHRVDQSTLDSYQYQRLDGPNRVRLVVLHPARLHDSDLICSLIHVDLDSTTFEALSYVWGSSEESCPIICDGALLHVTKNLDIALRRLRRNRGDRLLWVDAICINQADIAEKEQQIPLMREIYSQAQHSIVWLGEENHDLGDYHALFYIHYYCWLFRGCKVLLSLAFGKHWRSIFPHIMPSNDDDVHTRWCRRLLEREWFTRTWTLQELLLNERSVIVCGQRSISADRVAFFATHCMSLPRYSMGHEWQYHHAQGQILLRQYLKKQNWVEEHLSALEFMMVVKSAMTTEPKDKVIGIQAILQQYGLRLPRLTYDMTEEDLCRNLTTAWISHWRSIHVLSLQRSPIGSHNSASWAIAWNDSGQLADQVIMDHYARTVYLRCLDGGLTDISATKHTRVPAAVLEVDSELALRGILLSRIRCSVGPSGTIYRKVAAEAERNSPALWAQTVKTIILWARFMKANGYGDSRDLLRALAAILNVGPSMQLFSRDEDLNVQELDKTIDLGNYIEKDDQRLIDLVGQSGLIRSKLWRALRVRVDNETLFVTTDGRLGISQSRSIQDDDLVALVTGSDFPLILRRQEGRDDNFTYVGPSIVSSAPANVAMKSIELPNASFRSKHKRLRPVLRSDTESKGRIRNHYFLEWEERGVISSTMQGKEWHADKLQDIRLV